MRAMNDTGWDRCLHVPALRIVAAACALLHAGCLGASLGRQVVEIRRQVDDLGAERARIRKALDALGPAGRHAESSVAGAVWSDPDPGAPAGAGAPPSGAALYRGAYVLFQRGEYEEAESRLRAFLAADPGSSLGPDAIYWIAECLRARGRYREAIAEFRSVMEQRPPGDLAARALYGIGLAWRSLGEDGAAREAFGALVRDFPASDVAALARQRLRE
jgi:tol-pal system protein YbgF